MTAFRKNYWSISNLATWVRGTSYPTAATSDEWDEIHRVAKAKHPVRFWTADSGLSFLQNIISKPIDIVHNVINYIRNRFIDHSHALTAHKKSIAPGQYCDLSGRILPCLFDELVDFVEVECAYHNLWCGGDSEFKFEKKPGWWAQLRGWRNAESGLDFLNWAAQLTYGESEGITAQDPQYGKLYGKFTPQAIGSQEILALYHWYVNQYLTREDAMDASGWTEFCDRKTAEQGSLFSDKPMSSGLKKMQRAASTKLRKLEAAYDKEDTEMLIRLIKVRGQLWT